jgi:short-subunit dehydrogenase
MPHSSKKLIVVTGGSKGIGKAIIHKFIRHGFDVVTCARSEFGLKLLVEDMQELRPNAQVHTLAADLSTKEGVNHFADFVKNLGRKVDVLVNNTGFFVPGQVHNEEEGILEKMIETNLYSAYHLTRQLVGGMIKEQDGYIFNICSTASIMPYVNGGSYCISKFALYGMTKVLREEMKEHNVRVTAILPGPTLTASWDGVNLPPDRFIKSEDVAEALFGAYSMSKQSVVEEVLIRPQLGDI